MTDPFSGLGPRNTDVDELRPNTFEAELDAELFEIREMLSAKNQAYGDSVLNPVRVFSRADPIEGLHVRIDDKLSRLARGDNAGEDVVRDLIGYLVMLRIAMRRMGE
jgi:hypothetical protein